MLEADNIEKGKVTAATVSKRGGKKDSEFGLCLKFQSEFW